MVRSKKVKTVLTFLLLTMYMQMCNVHPVCYLEVFLILLSINYHSVFRRVSSKLSYDVNVKLPNENILIEAFEPPFEMTKFASYSFFEESNKFIHAAPEKEINHSPPNDSEILVKGEMKNYCEIKKNSVR